MRFSRVASWILPHLSAMTPIRVSGFCISFSSFLATLFFCTGFRSTFFFPLIRWSLFLGFLSLTHYISLSTGLTTREFGSKGSAGGAGGRALLITYFLVFSYSCFSFLGPRLNRDTSQKEDLGNHSRKATSVGVCEFLHLVVTKAYDFCIKDVGWTSTGPC